MKNALIAVLAIALTASITWLFFPRTEYIGTPTIRTVWDTVVVLEPRLDTVWRTRTIRKTDTLPNIIDTVTVQAAPDTVWLDTLVLYSAVCPQALQVGQYGKRDEPTVLEGKTVTTDSAMRSILEHPWRVTYYTPGPLDAFVFDTFPPRPTFRAPPRECGFWCRASLIGLGTLVGAGVTGAACVVSHVP